MRWRSLVSTDVLESVYLYADLDGAIKHWKHQFSLVSLLRAWDTLNTLAVSAHDSQKRSGMHHRRRLLNRDVSHNNGWIMYHLHWAVKKQKCEKFPVEASKKSSRWKCMNRNTKQNKINYLYVNDHDLSEQNWRFGWCGIDWTVT